MSRILINDGQVLLEKVILAESLADRMRGLLGRHDLPADTGMLLRPCGSIHMWGMRFPIDAAFLDRDLRVLRIASNLQPGQIAMAPHGTHCVLETAAGILEHLALDTQLTLDSKE